MSTAGTFTLQSKLTRYTLKERIGAGGMATVYRAWDTKLERDVAIKVLHEHLSFDNTFQERFEREAKFVAGFHHPHIVQIFDFATIETDEAPIYYMVMPFLTGATLEHIIDNYCQHNEDIPKEITIRLVNEIASALDYAHARGMIHRDVKPANILYDSHNRALLTDFGIARLAETGNLTAEGMTVGTPAYMPPEQAQGLEIDHRADIYSFGVIVYELITRTPPYGDGSVSVMLQHVNATIPVISEFLPMANEALDAVINKVLAKNPEDRYQTATLFAEDLSNALHGNPIKNPQQTTVVLDTVNKTPGSKIPIYVEPKPKAKNKPAQSSPLGILAIGLALIAFVLVIALLIQSPDETGQETASLNIADSMTGDIFFSSTFDEEDTMMDAWDISDNEFISRDVVDGQYVINNRRSNTATTSLFDQIYTYDNVIISMDAHLVDAESQASGYGIVFRYVDAENYNVFAVDGRGRYSIWVRENGEWLELRQAESSWTSHPAVNLQTDNNTLTIEIYENTFTGLVNDVEVVQIEDDTIDKGGIGIYLATTPQGEATIEVDSFTVSESIISTTSMTDDSDDFSESMTSNE